MSHELFSEQDTLDINYTNSVRKDLVKKLIKDTIVVPEDKSDKIMLLGLLDGIDRNILSRAKIKVDKKAADNSGAVADMVSQALSLIPNNILNKNPDIQAPVLTDDIPLPVLVEGETTVGNYPISIDEFMQQNKKEI